VASYTLGVVTPAPAANGFFFDLAAAATDRLNIREIGVSLNAATASTLALFRSTAIGTRTTPTTGLAEDPADPAGTGTIATAWSVNPTMAAAALRRLALPATAGAGIVWTWPYGKGLVVPVSASIVLQNVGAAAASALSVYVTWDE
jgi:hypothetical protein